MRDQAQSTASSAAGAMQTQAQYAAGKAKGAASAVTPGGTRLQEPDDVTLARKVETHIFRSHEAPKGSVSVDVQAGVAYLRGVATPEWIDRLAEEARQVEGISGVKNLLHTPGTPTPAAEPRFLAAQNLHRS
jgi:osmotically-inducible protein OsmY